MTKLTIFPLLLLFSLPLQAAPFQGSYRRGIQSEERGRWEVVVRQMRLALRQNPTPGGRRVHIYGVRYEPYLPYYHLGKALQELGRLNEALAAFTKSKQAGEVATVGLAADVDRRLADLRKRVVPPVAATEAIPSATPTAGQTAKPTPTPAAAPSAKPAPEPPRAPSGTPQPSPTASSALRIDKYVSSATKSVGSAQSLHRKVMALANQIGHEKIAEHFPPFEAEVEKGVLAISQGRSSLKRGQGEQDLDLVLAARDQASGAVRIFERLQRKVLEIGRLPERKAPEPTPLEILEAIERYAEVDYENAARLADSCIPDDRRMAALGAMIVSASRYAVALLGEGTTKARSSAREAALRAQRLAPSLNPPEEVFPSEFRSYYAELRSDILPSSR